MSDDKLDWHGCRTWLENVSLELWELYGVLHIDDCDNQISGAVAAHRLGRGREMFVVAMDSFDRVLDAVKERAAELDK